MDKITRVLLLYSKLIRGEPVNKLSFCMETDTSGRNFDRDIEDIRLYLSEMYQIDEVLYDRGKNNYYLSGVQRQELEIIEYRFLEHLLIESKVLRCDELAGILYRLASNTKNISKYMEKGITSLEKNGSNGCLKKNFRGQLLKRLKLTQKKLLNLLRHLMKI